jgi:CRP/FNR family transcriptional regulator, polysaccharide utilization system transcription regulator
MFMPHPAAFPFELLSPADEQLMNNEGKVEVFQRREELFLEGKQPACVYILQRGKVKLFTTDMQGREQIVHLARPGDLMGYRAVLGNDAFSCSAAALETTSVLVIPKAVFFQILDHNPTLSHYIIKLLTTELRHAEHHLAGLARKHVRSRLAEVALLLAETYGYEKDGSTLAVQLTREEVAGLVGTATETVIRLLHSLRDDGLLATDGRKIRLLDIPGLQRLAESN